MHGHHHGIHHVGFLLSAGVGDGEGVGEAEVLGEREAEIEFEAFDELGVGGDHEDGVEELFEAGDSDVFGGGLDIEFVFEGPELGGDYMGSKGIS